MSSRSYDALTTTSACRRRPISTSRNAQVDARPLPPPSSSPTAGESTHSLRSRRSRIDYCCQTLCVRTDIRSDTTRCVEAVSPGPPGDDSRVQPARRPLKAAYDSARKASVVSVLNLTRKHNRLFVSDFLRYCYRTARTDAVIQSWRTPRWSYRLIGVVQSQLPWTAASKTSCCRRRDSPNAGARSPFLNLMVAYGRATYAHSELASERIRAAAAQPR